MCVIFGNKVRSVVVPCTNTRLRSRHVCPKEEEITPDDWEMFVIGTAEGAPLDASIGEHGHQRHKRANVSGSGRDPAAHHARRVNTLFSLRRLMTPGVSWMATRYDRSARTRIRSEEKAGPGCSRVLRSLDGYLRGGLEAEGVAEEGSMTRRGQYQGAAIWNSKITRRLPGQNSQTNEPEQDWEAQVAQSGIVPYL